MFKSIFATAFVLLTLCAQAQQYALTGSVSDGKSTLALPGATVVMEGNNRFCVVDEFGRFRFEKLPAGDYVLHIQFLGYENKTEKVILNGNQEVTILLEEAVQLTDEVVVSATRANEKTPTTFSMMDKLTIAKQNFGQDLPLILNWTPSLVTTSDAGAGVGYTGLRIRGSDATRINVTINGIPYNDSESQSTYWVDIPDAASSTQNIQIQRGVGTSTNGAGAFGGSINLQTSTLQADPYTEINVAAGSFNTQRYTLKAGTGLLHDHWAFDGKVSKIKSDGYIDRASSDLGSYYLSGGYYGKKTIVKGIAFGGAEETYQSWYGVDPETMKTNRRFNYAGALYDANYNVLRYYDNQVDHYQQDHYQLHFSHQFNPNWNANVSLHYTYGRGYYEQYNQNQVFADMGLSDIVLKDTTLTSGDFVVRKWLNNKFYGVTFSLNYEKGKTNFVLGGALNQYGHVKHYGEINWAQYAGNVQPSQHYYDGTSQKNDFNIYAKWNYDITEALNVFVDLQYRYIAYETAGINAEQREYTVNETYNFFNPKAGLSYSLSAQDILYASYAIANREPNRVDFLESSVKPKPERLENLEVGWRKNTNLYHLEANYYLMNYKDQLVLTGAIDNVGNPIRANVGKSYRTGIEVSGTVRFSDQWSWNANITQSVNKNKDFVSDENNVTVKKNTAIILSPNLIIGSQLTWSAFKNFQTTLLSKYVSQQYLDNTENKALMLDSYFINDLRFNYRIFAKGIKAIDLSLLVNNILNVEYSSNGYGYDGVPYYFPQAGTNFMVMVSLKL